jgi:pimeloyl-ACP methyl ester carboxylesterase
MRRAGKYIATLGTILTLLAFVLSPAPANADDATTCRDVDVPVTLALLLRTTMHGTLCSPASPRENTVIVLVPGGTYNSSYWNFPWHPDVYNFRQAMNSAGYSTFTLDRLGTGESARLPSLLATTTTQATAVHQVIQGLRSGQVGGNRFGKVVLGGHSLGSAIAIIEAGTFRDVDAVLLTGFAHQFNVEGAAGLFVNSMHPVLGDPVLGGKGYDPTYLTTRPGTRDDYFLRMSTTEPRVAELDELFKDVLSPAEAADAAALGAVAPSTALINVPVLVVNGDADVVMCSPLFDNCASAERMRRLELAYYAASPCLRTFLLPGAGHAVNLAMNTRVYHQRVRAWLANPCA